MRTALGIDVGGSGVKGALVDLDKGEFVTERFRIETPQPATPEAVADVIGRIVEHFGVGDDAPIGVCFPAPLPDGVAPYIANLDQAWAGLNVAEFIGERIGRSVSALNDADAAGLAEMRHGVGKTRSKGVVLFTTLGTGIGSALFIDGRLVPNTELGHLEIDGHDAESRAAASVRKAKDLSWPKYIKRLQRYYEVVVNLFSPSLIVVGGGISRKHDKFLPHLKLRCEIVPAELRNTAGIVGAATFAAEQSEK
ncbi:ROK family protein [Nanchangia anserum]|uniref:ROK family protein n=1 Tax=Nanchangia anserum TaxID=2692125 RepID=A0A8I0GBH0_9ACTO|nr:ROK family protein [Nanchangia anserum]MBD3688961.1 ROK family protein [Nanchangia anserum]QOX81218.1 ROK family protein [Nanchangia anserum]